MIHQCLHRQCVVTHHGALSTNLQRFQISGIEELRYKESDRIMAMENGLRAIGINVCSSKDSIEITGGKIKGGKVNSYDDHRIAMSFAIAGLISQNSLTIMNTENKISLQHILVMYMQTKEGSVQGPYVQKHWRQDWTYEDTNIITFEGDKNLSLIHI